MNAIIGMAELLLEGPLDEARGRYVTTLRNAGDNLLNINDILDISKIEAGYLELHESVFDLRTRGASCPTPRRYESGTKASPSTAG